MSKKAIITKEGTEVRDQIIDALTTKRRARFMWLGTFKVIKKKGGKRYDFATRKMVPFKDYQTVIFTPAEGLHDLLNPGNPRRKKKGKK